MKGWIHTLMSVMVATVLTRSIARAARVTTTYGEIEGITETIDDVIVDMYLGVPFASPPVGDLRFRAPKSADEWTGVKQTKTLPNSCMQLPDTAFGRFEGVDMWNANTEVNEDCLYLNLWVPRTNVSMPTMVWIYGGSFTYGSMTLDVYDGRYLAAKQGVIVASMQYRMGVMGFLFSGNDDAPGNMGLLDQQLAIKWIYDNIESFGGEVSKITLFGESAGAASISHHLLAPSSWPYFNNAIMLSSTSLAPWAIDKPADVLQLTLSLAEQMDCEDTDLREIIKCLRSANASDLELKQWSLDIENIGTFSPTVDGNFLTDYPSQLLHSGKMKDADILLGVTKDEGEYFMIYFYPDVFPADSIGNPSPLNRTQFLDLMCRVADCQGNLDRDGVLYTYEESVLPPNRGSYRDIIDNMLGDSYFKCSVRGLASYHTSISDRHTYVYSFEYRHSENPWPSWMGVLHGYEIEMVFAHPFNPSLNYTDLDRVVSTSVTDYFATFARTGRLDSSGSTWPEFTRDAEQHIVFSQDGSTSVREGFRTKECTFWDYLMPKLKQAISESTTSGAGYYSMSVILVCLSVIISAIIDG